MKIKYEKNVDKKEMDMCNGMEEYKVKVEIEAVIKAYKAIGMKDDGIIDTIVSNFQVTKEYVKSLLEAKPA